MLEVKGGNLSVGEKGYEQRMESIESLKPAVLGIRKLSMIISRSMAGRGIGGLPDCCSLHESMVFYDSFLYVEGY